MVCGALGAEGPRRNRTTSLCQVPEYQSVPRNDPWRRVRALVCRHKRQLGRGSRSASTVARLAWPVSRQNDARRCRPHGARCSVLVPRQRLWPRFEVVIWRGFGSRRSDEGTQMRSKSSIAKKPAEQVVKDIRRASRRRFFLRAARPGSWPKCCAHSKVSLSRDVSTVDENRLGRDPLASRRGKECHKRHDVLDPTETPGRHAAGGEGGGVLGFLSMIEAGIDRAGRDRVDGDAAHPDFERQRTRKVLKRCLGAGVDRIVGRGPARSEYRRYR